MHRGTLYYRLRRFAELTGIDLQDGAERLTVHVTIRRCTCDHPARGTCSAAGVEHVGQDLVDDLAEQHQVPELAVGVLTDAERLVATSGVTSTSGPLVVTADSLFHIGSTTKTMTATALLAQRLAQPAVLDVLTVRPPPGGGATNSSTRVG